jgi:hypothetical protein
MASSQVQYLPLSTAPSETNVGVLISYHIFFFLHSTNIFLKTEHKYERGRYLSTAHVHKCINARKTFQPQCVCHHLNTAFAPPEGILAANTEDTVLGHDTQQSWENKLHCTNDGNSYLIIDAGGGVKLIPVPPGSKIKSF